MPSPTPASMGTSPASLPPQPMATTAQQPGCQRQLFTPCQTPSSDWASRPSPAPGLSTPHQVFDSLAHLVLSSNACRASGPMSPQGERSTQAEASLGDWLLGSPIARSFCRGQRASDSSVRTSASEEDPDLFQMRICNFC
mmetsp:Transcript_141017/g.351694  ORF Transcript_141017/g.351694 Transcript_141017/m.351694 type:complete len:140 (-) Transcript_141017:5-424(-)